MRPKVTVFIGSRGKSFMAKQMSAGRKVTDSDGTKFVSEDIDILMINEIRKGYDLSWIVNDSSCFRIPYTNEKLSPKEIFIVCQASYDDIKNLDCIDNIVICNYKGE